MTDPATNRNRADVDERVVSGSASHEVTVTPSIGPDTWKPGDTLDEAPDAAQSVESQNESTFAPDYPFRPSLRAWLRMPRRCWRLWRDDRKRLRKMRRLHYASSRCECGALYAYDPREKPRPSAWDCSDILLGVAIPKGKPGSVRHGDKMPFIFWKVKEAPREWALEHRRSA